MEERAAPRGLHRHDIRVGRWCVGRCPHPARVDSKPLQVLQDECAIGVGTDHSDALQRQRRCQCRKVHEHIVGGSTGPAGQAENIGQMLLFGQLVDQLDMIDDPVARGNDALLRVHVCANSLV